MTALYRFKNVRCAGVEGSHDFTLNSGDIRLLELDSHTGKENMIALAMGEKMCDTGRIEIAGALNSLSVQVENQQIDDYWQTVNLNNPNLAWVAGNGGLISNLKIWENITLPRWYRIEREVLETERRIIYWLNILGLHTDFYVDFMASLPFCLEPWQRKLAGLLRALVSMPTILIVDADVFNGVSREYLGCWIAALEEFAAQDQAILVVADETTSLPWKRIE